MFDVLSPMESIKAGQTQIEDMQHQLQNIKSKPIVKKIGNKKSKILFSDYKTAKAPMTEKAYFHKDWNNTGANFSKGSSMKKKSFKNVSESQVVDSMNESIIQNNRKATTYQTEGECRRLMLNMVDHFRHPKINKDLSPARDEGAKEYKSNSKSINRSYSMVLQEKFI